MITLNRLWTMCVLIVCTLVQTLPALSATALQGAAMSGESADPVAKDRLALDQALHLDIIGSSTGAIGKYAVVEAQFQNTSGRTITAHAGRVLGRYADGTERIGGWGQDIVGATALSRVPGLRLQTPDTLNSGETRRLRLSVPLDPRGSPPVYVAGMVTMVIFEDRTALGDAEQIRFVLERRAKDSEELSDVLAVVQKARAEPAIQQAIDAGRASEAASLLAVSITQRINELKEVKPQPEPYTRRVFELEQLGKALSSPAGIRGLDLAILMDQTTQRALAEHSSLKEAK